MPIFDEQFLVAAIGKGSTTAAINDLRLAILNLTDITEYILVRDKKRLGKKEVGSLLETLDHVRNLMADDA